MNGARYRQDRVASAALEQPLLAVFAECGPAHSLPALRMLKDQGRVSLGTTAHQAGSACDRLVRAGRLEVRRSAPHGVPYYRVPGDDRPRWDA